MRLIVVAAPVASSGKSLLICRLLEAFPKRVTAVKLSDHLPDARAVGATTGPGCDCRAPGSPFTVIDDDAVLGDPEKDTGRFIASGARRVIWCRASRAHVAAAWSHLTERHLEADEIVVAEGSRALEADSPLLTLLVVNPEIARERWKDTAPRLVDAADVIVWNRHPRRGERIESPDEAAGALAALAGPGAQGRCIVTGDLVRPFREEFPMLYAVLAAALRGSEPV